MDQLFGMRRSGTDSTVVPQMRGMVAAAVIQTTEGRRHYVARMSELLTNIFELPPLTNRVARIAAGLRPAFGTNGTDLPPEERRRRFNGDFNPGFAPTPAHFEAAVTLLQNRMASRAASVREQLQQYNSPVQFGSARVIELSNWDWQRDYGSAPLPRRSVNGDDLLEINFAGNAVSRASWRTAVLLKEGHYQFHGLVRLEPLTGRLAARGEPAICLRTSEDSTSLSVTNAMGWIALTNNFVVTSPKYVDLICEFAGGRGRAQFDLTTLKLRQQ